MSKTLALSGFSPDVFGTLEINIEKMEAKISVDVSSAEIIMVNHPVLGVVPSYKASIYDLCYKAFEELTKRMEN